MNLPNEILTLLWSIFPITEIRFSIPMAISVYKLSVSSAIFWSVAGNILSTFFLLWWLDPIVNFFISKAQWIKTLALWLFARTRDKAAKKYVKYGQWVLIVFVAIPLPGTGAWSGAVIAYLFDIPKGRALVLISLGIIFSAILVTLATLGVTSSLNFLNY